MNNLLIIVVNGISNTTKSTCTWTFQLLTILACVFDSDVGASPETLYNRMI